MLDTRQRSVGCPRVPPNTTSVFPLQSCWILPTRRCSADKNKRRIRKRRKNNRETLTTKCLRRLEHSFDPGRSLMFTSLSLWHFSATECITRCLVFCFYPGVLWRHKPCVVSWSILWTFWKLRPMKRNKHTVLGDFTESNSFSRCLPKDIYSAISVTGKLIWLEI